MRPIDADALHKKIFPYSSLVDPKTYAINAGAVEYAIQTSPTVDAVEVVRCKDCRFLTHLDDGTPECTRVYLGIVHDNDFCSYGERREQ